LLGSHLPRECRRNHDNSWKQWLSLCQILVCFNCHWSPSNLDTNETEETIHISGCLYFRVNLHVLCGRIGFLLERCPRFKSALERVPSLLPYHRQLSPLLSQLLQAGPEGNGEGRAHHQSGDGASRACRGVPLLLQQADGWRHRRSQLPEGSRDEGMNDGVSAPGDEGTRGNN
jgi:hypothetical protein